MGIIINHYFWIPINQPENISIFQHGCIPCLWHALLARLPKLFGDVGFFLQPKVVRPHIWVVRFTKSQTMIGDRPRAVTSRVPVRQHFTSHLFGEMHRGTLFCLSGCKSNLHIASTLVFQCSLQSQFIY